MIYKFDEFVGNSVVFSLMKRMLVKGSFPQFSIFEGMMGTGKSSSAKLVAMRLTCENPSGANPCCKCASCKNNLKAFSSTGQSGNVKIVNIGEFDTKSDVKTLIKDIFVLKSSSGATIYVLEEVHALKEVRGAQTAFLEEIDRMPENVYVIMCTTKGFDVIDELQSRALKFNFKRLSMTESKILINREGCTDPDITALVARNSKGLPRNIINSIKFIRENEVSRDEYLEFISEVSDSSILFLFETHSILQNYLSVINDLLEQREPSVVFRAIKSVMVKVLFVVEGLKVEGFTSAELYTINDIFDYAKVVKIFNLLGKYTERLSADDLIFMLFQIRLVIEGRGVTSVYAESPKVAEITRNAVPPKEKSSPTAGLRKLGVHSLESFS